MRRPDASEIAAGVLFFGFLFVSLAVAGGVWRAAAVFATGAAAVAIVWLVTMVWAQVRGRVPRSTSERE